MLLFVLCLFLFFSLDSYSYFWVNDEDVVGEDMTDQCKKAYLHVRDLVSNVMLRTVDEEIEEFIASPKEYKEEVINMLREFVDEEDELKKFGPSSYDAEFTKWLHRPNEERMFMFRNKKSVEEECNKKESF